MLYFFHTKKEENRRSRSSFLEETIDWFLNGREELLSLTNPNPGYQVEPENIKNKKVDIAKIKKELNKEKVQVKKDIKLLKEILQTSKTCKSIVDNFYSVKHLDKEKTERYIMRNMSEFYKFINYLPKIKNLENIKIEIQDNTRLKQCIFTSIIEDIYNEIFNDCYEKDFKDLEIIVESGIKYFNTRNSFVKYLNDEYIFKTTNYIDNILVWIEYKLMYLEKISRYYESINTLIDIAEENIKSNFLPLSEEGVVRLAEDLSNRIKNYSKSSSCINDNLDYYKMNLLTR